MLEKRKICFKLFVVFSVCCYQEQEKNGLNNSEKTNLNRAVQQ
jgi:hypothetical protein